MSQIGRISGPLLEANLQRDNNLAFDTDLLYLEISGNKVGIKNSSPTRDLDVTGYTNTVNGIISNSATFNNVVFNSSGTISSYVGPVIVQPAGSDPYINFNHLKTEELSIKGNLISSYNSNSNIQLEANGTGLVIFEENTYVQGDLEATGTISIDGNLTYANNIIVGDSIYDVVTGPDVDGAGPLNPTIDLNQDLIPGTTNTWNLGIDANDSSERKWNNFYVNNSYFDTTPVISNLSISDQILINGVTRTITTVQSNDNLIISPDTGITLIENIRIQDNVITNLDNTALTFSHTGIGYLQFTGTAGLSIPSGTTGQRPGGYAAPQAGATRWNTDLNSLECFDGTVWIFAVGPGDPITETEMEELGHIYTMILG